MDGPGWNRRSALGLLVGTGAAHVVRPRGEAGSAGGAGRARRGARPVLLGAWVPGGGSAELEGKIGRSLDIEHWYEGWGEDANDFDLDRATAVTDRGAIPMVTWEPWDYRQGKDQPRYALRRIARGRFDGYLRRQARRMAALDGPLWLRFAHEMNGKAYPWSIGVNGNTGDDYVRAWRRIVRIFRRQGAKNVRFIWCPLVPGPGTTSLRKAFPGDDVVSFVGMDGYNAGTEADWGGWLTFDQVFGDLYRRLRRISRRPVIIAETGCAEEGGDKAVWIRRGLRRTLPRRFPAVRAVVWFNESREADWRLESSADALAAAQRTFRSTPFA